MLKLNSQSYDVAAVQTALNQIGASRQRTMLPYLLPDGIFGVKTHARVVEFQRTNGLKPDGVVGPQTLAAIGELLPAVTPAGRPVGGVPAVGDTYLKDTTNVGYKPRKPDGGVDSYLKDMTNVGYKPRKPDGGVDSYLKDITNLGYKPRKPEYGF